MKKSISKQQIIETALELLKDKSDIRKINLREIARVLGCAHTNLYNYFPSFNDLLWEAHMEIVTKFIQQMDLILEGIQDPKAKLYQFYYFLSEFYLDNKGWFRLAWLDYIDVARPDKDKIATEKTVETMVEWLSDIWTGIYLNKPDKKSIHRVLHDVHCYIIGEVSNYINGRGLIQDEILLKQHIAETSVTFFTLHLRKEYDVQA
ncbi:TetR/AcrR family transcriptional regulator [Paenibacillus sanguinis]|uniref:TetR/AcrR family transcriptional regulator n=1 Tax=Paenibacillus sanguinis TaxID=225906 RepID=UPI000371EA65|nr:TetR/AcrR family transcriptional regulator [Paenibacillus sanguinis]